MVGMWLWGEISRCWFVYLQRKMNDGKWNYNGLYRVEKNITKKKKKQRKAKKSKDGKGKKGSKKTGGWRGGWG